MAENIPTLLRMYGEDFSLKIKRVDQYISKLNQYHINYNKTYMAGKFEEMLPQAKNIIAEVERKEEFMQKKNDYHNFFKKTLFKSAALDKEVAELRITEMNERNTKAIEEAFPEVKKEGGFTPTVEELIALVRQKKRTFEL